jgi:hypothetical protein
MPMTTPRHHSHTRSLLVSVAVAIPALLIGAGLSAPSAQAGYIVTLTQMADPSQPLGFDVVATGSGTIDLTDLTPLIENVNKALIQPSTANILTGPATFEAFDTYKGFTGPTNFGSGGETFATSGDGDFVGINDGSNLLSVPIGYVNNPRLLSSSATWDNASFSSLGVTSGTYEWTWGTGTHADSFTLQVGAAAVPAPVIGRGLPVILAVGGLLFGAKLLERGKRRGLQFG